MCIRSKAISHLYESDITLKMYRNWIWIVYLFIHLVFVIKTCCLLFRLICFGVRYYSVFGFSFRTNVIKDILKNDAKVWSMLVSVLLFLALICVDKHFLCLLRTKNRNEFSIDIDMWEELLLRHCVDRHSFRCLSMLGGLFAVLPCAMYVRQMACIV